MRHTETINAWDIENGHHCLRWPPQKDCVEFISRWQPPGLMQVNEASTSTFLNNENTPTDIEVEATSTLSPQDKGKGPEQIILPVKNTPIDLDQSFDIAENMLDNTK
ncbi:7970_t:CDS:2 [Funneliformis geosporum]|nr:7970_t:CDS:2 [Funneliformis geosporum]